MTKRTTHWHETLKAEVLADPGMLAEYEAFKSQLELAQKMRLARQKVGLTQEDVAKKMHTQKPVIARLEAAGGKQHHSPSLTTLQKYAKAIGYRIRIDLIPDKKKDSKQ